MSSSKLIPGKEGLFSRLREAGAKAWEGEEEKCKLG